MLLVRLEEAIGAGQFDKASAVAKELAVIKRKSFRHQDSDSVESSAPLVNKKKTDIPRPVFPPQPVPAPRSIVPAVTSPSNGSSAPPPPKPAKRTSVKESNGSVTTNNDVKTTAKKKVDSGQQTTITYRATVSSTATDKRQPSPSATKDGDVAAEAPRADVPMEVTEKGVADEEQPKEKEEPSIKYDDPFDGTATRK